MTTWLNSPGLIGKRPILEGSMTDSRKISVIPHSLRELVGVKVTQRSTALSLLKMKSKPLRGTCSKGSSQTNGGNYPAGLSLFQKEFTDKSRPTHDFNAASFTAFPTTSAEKLLVRQQRQQRWKARRRPLRRLLHRAPVHANSVMPDPPPFQSPY